MAPIQAAEGLAVEVSFFRRVVGEQVDAAAQQSGAKTELKPKEKFKSERRLSFNYLFSWESLWTGTTIHRISEMTSDNYDPKTEPAI